MSNPRIVIIGNGISGITAARHIRKRSDAEITVIGKESEHFFSRTALMYVYMGHMRYQDIKPYEDHFWEKNRIGLKHGTVTRVDTERKIVELTDGGTLTYDSLIIATGSESNRFGWPGQDLPGVQGLYSLQDLESMEENTKGIQRAVIAGGGLIGVEMAEMLRTRNIDVTFLVREHSYWGGILPKQEAGMITRHMQEHGVELRFNTELEEVLAGDDGRVRAISTKGGEEIACGFVGLAVGVHPNIAWLKGSPEIKTGKGVLVNENLETSASDVYAIGDCVEFHKHPDPQRKNIEQVWYTGRMMGETVALTITGERTAYDPGIWFNSAKFFDIEYQTYGWVRNNLQEGEADHYWEHPNGRSALHLVWNAESRVLHGVNSFGFRLRHEVFDRWLREKATVDHVVQHLHEAAFDPEFFERTEMAVRASFNQATSVIA
ncbi:MAG: NAD(P)/FAD-dependent oxidoreductase [Flavobacteriales bacterium]|jgi:NADPH-dependent 2,4-dienoyl-CoA reductase/sulfur reductase-like enzyme|nr:NAD(P)/FAD-dependent oxidoreductase [Flavobacteriales bacterium]MBK6894808.1 NAD(P)/FAD-dependent oxidoreductase [Flavobacteriales bacterium]MBK9599687.1 NAD(P)/FAD-dependent oxidoreductase [Flavobacteriales bacterium]QQS71510.1 MAG: NAD(P)/FAD-dependent oxidoreductase [Flavobacteriales bacterium]HQV38451.1 FAD-dependent oxidoreductase [Flavobacteriales bacterium]